MIPDPDAPMRIIEHPGDPLPSRSSHLHVDASDPVRLMVKPGNDLFATVHAELDARDASGGSFTIVGGTVDRLTLMTGGPGPDDMPVGFHGPHPLAGQYAAVAGAAGSGLDETGSRFTHCHAAFRGCDGKLIGGHLILDGTIAGADGIAVDLVVLRRGRFKRQFDTETFFTIFHPEQI